MKPKLLILSDWFYPGFKAGGPIVSTTNLAIALREDYEVFVLTTDTDHGDEKPYQDVVANIWTVFNGIQVYYASQDNIGFRQLGKLIQEVNADFIYLNHLYSPRFVLLPLWLKLRHRVVGRIILCPRGALFPSAISHKGYKKRPLIKLLQILKVKNFIRFHASNAAEVATIEEHFKGSEIITVANLPVKFDGSFQEIAKEFGELKLIFVGRILSIKNLQFLLQLLSKLDGDLELSIVGPIEDVQYWEQCQQEINRFRDNIKVNYLGPLPQLQILNLLQKHHIMVLPTKGENYGHSIVESWIAGRPVLISDQTPWKELKSKRLGWAIPLKESEWLSALKEAINWNQAEFTTYCRNCEAMGHSLGQQESQIQQYKILFS